MTLATEHVEISNRFLRHAEEQFQLGDMPQASEKAWGAVAHYLKSIAKRRSWRNRSHRDLSRIVIRLANDSRDPDRIKILFNSANSLHSNFYEDWLEDELVRDGIEHCRELIYKLENELGA